MPATSAEIHVRLSVPWRTWMEMIQARKVNGTITFSEPMRDEEVTLVVRFSRTPLMMSPEWWMARGVTDPWEWAEPAGWVDNPVEVLVNGEPIYPPDAHLLLATATALAPGVTIADIRAAYRKLIPELPNV